MNPMIKTAVVDIDNTLWHFCDVLYEKLTAINKSVPKPEHWSDWDFYQAYCSEKDFFGKIYDIHINQAHADYLPYPEAKGFLSTLRNNGYNIIIASHRRSESREATEKWLSKHELVYDELHLSFDKTVLFDTNTHVVVDDAPHILEKAVEKGAMGTGLLYAWNRSYANNGFKLCSNLDEILRHILDDKMRDQLDT